MRSHCLIVTKARKKNYLLESILQYTSFLSSSLCSSALYNGAKLNMLAKSSKSRKPWTFLLFCFWVHVLLFSSLISHMLLTALLNSSPSVKAWPWSRKMESFVLGFFTPRKSTNRYLGIWYNNNSVDQTVVWVANRLNPINDSSGVLMVNNSCSLVLLSQNSSTIAWSANSTKQALNPMVQLLD